MSYEYVLKYTIADIGTSYISIHVRTVHIRRYYTYIHTYKRLYLYLSAVLPAVIVDAGERRSNEKIFFNSLVAAYTGVKHAFFLLMYRYLLFFNFFFTYLVILYV